MTKVPDEAPHAQVIARRDIFKIENAKNTHTCIPARFPSFPPTTYNLLSKQQADEVFKKNLNDILKQNQPDAFDA